jgi:hypothetical protein
MSLLACRTNTKPATGKNNAESKVDSAQIDSDEGIIYLMLSPNEILNEIFSTKIELNPDLLNPKNNAPKYLDIKHQALNLGVYIADFAYLNLCKDKSNALDYFRIIRNLAQKNNIYGCFDQSTFDRIQDNLANNDSLINISEEMYYHMTEILENANRQNINALISSGVLVESLYLSVLSIDKLPDYKELTQKIFGQKALFDDFYAFISTYKNDKDVKSVVDQLNILKKILNKSRVETEKQKIIKNHKNHLEVKGGQNIVVDEATFEQFKTNVIIVRQTFINVN